MRQFIVGVAAFVSIVVVACSSSDEDTDGAKATNTTGDASADGSTSDKSGLGTKDSSAPSPKTCSISQGIDACYECCEANHPGGAEPYDETLRTCLCAASACATECAESVCATTPTDPVEGDACSTCINDAVDCEAKAGAACDASAACTALAECIDASGCEPAVDGGT